MVENNVESVREKGRYLETIINRKKRTIPIASIEYVDENTILGQAEDADKAYVELILPDKICYNMKYIGHQSVMEYFKIIFLTIWSIVH